MRKIYMAIPLFLIASFACRKDKKSNTIHGIVKTKQEVSTSTWSNAWVVEITNPDASEQSFLCDKWFGMASSFYPNCGNAVFIINLPAHLAKRDQKIRFTDWKDISGARPAPQERIAHELEVYDAVIDP